MSDKILLVDDDQVFRDEFKNALEEYDVLEAANGEEALEILRKPNEIDLVILDVIMPGTNGIEVMKEIRKLSQEIGIIILTGYSTKDTAIEALKAHADDYIEKPPSMEKTKEIIERILDTKRSGYDLNAHGIRGKIEKTMRFATRNRHKKTFLKDAAAAIYLSPKYLSRLFKQMTGTRFSEFKLRIKINEAKTLLRETDFNINQIAYKLGYQNTESFIRIFKKITDTTPTEYRKRYESKLLTPS